MPMDDASSSSGFPSHAVDAKPANFGSRTTLREFEEYGDPNFDWETETHSLKKEHLDKYFGDKIHYDGKPVLFTTKDNEFTVKNALKNYKNIRLIGPNKNANMQIYKNDERYTRNFGYNAALHQHVQNAQKFGSDYGEVAQGLVYGRPFGGRKWGKYGFYNVPKWETIEQPRVFVYNLKKAGFNHLRSTLDRYNYLKLFDSDRGKLLGFKLDKDGGVIFKDLGHYLGRA